MKKRIVFVLLALFFIQNQINAQVMKPKQALLIIDVQNDYFEGGANPLEGSLEASENARKLLNAFRQNSLLIVHIKHISTRSGSTYFIPNTIGSEIHKNVMPLESEKIIVKNYPNSFRETELLDYLHANGITDLTICGMMTHMCVDATTRAAKDFGFNCTVISDACATKDLVIQGKRVKANDVHLSFIAALGYYYATIKYTDNCLGGDKDLIK